MKQYILFCILFCPLVVCAQLRLDPIFSDNMMLQRDQAINFFGKAIPGKEIDILFAGIHKKGFAKSDSSWQIRYPPMKINDRSYRLSVHSGMDSIIIRNIVFGDIWVCIGQSNMEFPMLREQHWHEEKSRVYNPHIRLINPIPAGRNLYTAPYTDSIIQRLNNRTFYVWGKWAACDSTSASDMSAVAYYFAQLVHQKTAVPIGIINLSIGGAPLESFLSVKAMQRHPIFKSKVQGNWLFNESLPVWIRERGMQNVGGLKNIPQDALGPFHAYKPGVAYQSGIQPLFQLPIKGVLCYQGESNAQEMERVVEYNRLMKLMLDDYRVQWKQSNLPFYFVQLSSIDTARYKSQLWPLFRDEQRKAMRLIAHSGMAVSSDLGAKNDVHPTNKKDVGERLARWALCQTYHQSMLPSGPLPLQAHYSNGTVMITFSYAAKGLKTPDGAPVRGFSIDGITAATASILPRAIAIQVATKPSYIYYGWKPYSDGNLVNSENLPASTFKIIVQ